MTGREQNRSRKIFSLWRVDLSKNGIDERLDLDRVFVQLKSKARQVEFRRCGIFFLQHTPGIFRSQIKFAGFVVTVSKTSQTAEKIRQIDRAGHFRVRIIWRGVVMELNRSGNVRGQLPNVRKNPAAVAMSEAKNLEF